MEWLMVLVFTLALYVMLVLPVISSERWKARGITTWGRFPAVIFFRTMKAAGLLDTLARPRAFWRIIATAGVPLVLLSMGMFLLLLLLTSYEMIRSPPLPNSYNSPRNILLIPGLNEYVPFVWGWIALFITMVVHEFAHGILSRVEGVRVKSMGIVTLLVAPIAAFVEPDEEELFGTEEKPPKVTKGARVRILAAGVISNFIVAIIAMALFFGPVIGAIAPVDRPVVLNVTEGSPGDLAGFERNMVVTGAGGSDAAGLYDLERALEEGGRIRVAAEGGEEVLTLEGDAVRGLLVTSTLEGSPANDVGMPDMTLIYDIDGHGIGGIEDFRAYMNTTIPGQEITVTTTNGVYDLVLTSRDDGVDNNGAGFIGILISEDPALYTSGVTFQEFPADEFLGMLGAIPQSGIQGFGTLLGLPFMGILGFMDNGFQGFSGWLTYLFEPTGWAEPLGGKIFWIANLLLWVGWINLYAGMFNCLPAVPLDGGHIFRDLVQATFEKVMSARKAEKMTKTVVMFLAWLILTSLLITVIAPFTHGLPL